MAYNSFSDIPITESDIDGVHVEAQGTRLTGTVLENKQVFDKYPDMIVEHFNDLCDYINTVSPSGDIGLSYTSTEIAYITSTLGCSEASITL